MLDRLEILSAVAWHHGAEELRVAADIVVDDRVERVAVLVIPCFVSHIVDVAIDSLRIERLRAGLQRLTALDDKHLGAGGRDGPGHGGAADAGADDHNVRSAGIGSHYFTAPSAKPRIMWRCNRNTTITIGTTCIITVALMVPHSTV